MKLLWCFRSVFVAYKWRYGGLGVLIVASLYSLLSCQRQFTFHVINSGKGFANDYIQVKEGRGG